MRRQYVDATVDEHPALVRTRGSRSLTREGA